MLLCFSKVLIRSLFCFSSQDALEWEFLLKCFSFAITSNTWLFIWLFFFFGHTTWLWDFISPILQWKHGIPTTPLPGNSLESVLYTVRLTDWRHILLSLRRVKKNVHFRNALNKKTTSNICKQYFFRPLCYMKFVF